MGLNSYKIKKKEAIKYDERLRKDTGLDSFDIQGGYYAGDLIELSSESGVGKTTVLLHLSRIFNQRGEKVLFVDAEKGIVGDLIDSMGLSSFYSDEFGSPFWKFPNNSYDVALNKLFDFNVLEDLLHDTILSGKPEYYYDHFIVDSITAISPNLPENARISDIRMGLFSANLSDFFKLYKHRLRNAGTTMWFTNQLRLHVGSRFQMSQAPTGGQATKFYPEIRFNIRKGTKLEEERDTVNGKNVKFHFGNLSYLSAAKNKRGYPTIETPLPIYFGRGVSNVHTLFLIMKQNDLITGGAGGRYEIIDPKNGDVVKVHGQKNVMMYVKENLDNIRAFLKDAGFYQQLHASDIDGNIEDYGSDSMSEDDNLNGDRNEETEINE